MSVLSTSPVKVQQDSSIRVEASVRPWSAIVCSKPNDNTLLVVDWFLLACHQSGYLAQATPLLGDDNSPYGMYLEVIAANDTEAVLNGVPWGSVDLVIAGDHLELVRAIKAGYVSRDQTTIIASCRRSFSQSERAIAAQNVLTEQEIDELAIESSASYYAFDGSEVASWYSLPTSAQAGLLAGAIIGSETTPLTSSNIKFAINELGVESAIQLEAFKRGVRLGKKSGGRIRRPRTAYQFTRRRRIQIERSSRKSFEQVIERCSDAVHQSHVPALQEAVFLACQFQDAAWGLKLVESIETILREEKIVLKDSWSAERSVIPDAIRSLTSLMVWPDTAWIANRKLRSERVKQIRSAHKISRSDEFELTDYIPLDAVDRNLLKHPRFRGKVNPLTPSILQPLRVLRINTTSLRGARQLRRIANTSKWRTQTTRYVREVDTYESWLTALMDSMRMDHNLARIVAKSGTIVQGSGAVREATRETAQAFWGKIVRQSIILDRMETGAGNTPQSSSIAQVIIPYVWNKFTRSGPLALWEYATPIMHIAMARTRGMSHADAVQSIKDLCV